MLRQSTAGDVVAIHIDNRRIGFDLDTIKHGLISSLVAKGLTIKEVAEIFGIHRHTAAKMASSDPPTTALFGSGEWTPACQDQKPKGCDRCGGKIARGSQLYCAACHSSGRDPELKRQRLAADLQDDYERIEAEYEKASSRKTLAQRRQKRRTG